MKAQATIDIGKNLTALLNKLAATIGTTTEKLYPYYVAKVKTLAYYHLVFGAAEALFVFLMTGLGLHFIHKRVFAKRDLSYAQDEWYLVLGVCCLIVAGIGALVGMVCCFAGVPTWLTQLKTPEPYAIEAMTDAARNLVGK